MLTELRIVNFALIEQLHIQFQPGFTVLTGETGAGKSLLIDAIALLVGGRASTDFIRTGQEEAHLEAAFHLPESHPLMIRLQADGAIRAGESDLLLKRVLSRTGRHRAYVNGSLCPLRLLEDLGGTLVDIHGQHEQQSLLSPSSQLDALDAFGCLEGLRQRYQDVYRTWMETRGELEGLQNVGGDRARLEELLRHQVQEIERAGLLIGEEERLQAERGRLVHTVRLRELVEGISEELQSDEQGVLLRLSRVGRSISELEQIDQAMEGSREQVQEAAVQLKDLAARVRDYADRLEADPARQEQVEDRLDLIHRLRKKYGGTIEAVLQTGLRAKEELSGLQTRDHRIVELTERIAALTEQVAEAAQQLTKKRREAAKRLKQLVAREFAAVRMEGAEFSILVEAQEGAEHCGSTGCDRVEFLLTSNPGEPPKPLGRVASGGELSRIMLALKTVLAERDHVPVLVFDEIDTGVGGAVAAAMGNRLRTLGRFHQVFCITHLPQVASQAEQHLLVSKKREGSRTITAIAALGGIGREEEIARMLGGATVTKKVRETAAELIAGAKDKR